MFEHVKKTIDWQGVPLTLESGLMARQADGAVLVTMGETKVLATAVGERKINTELDYFPLTVHYMERSYAAGKIPGGFFKREGRPTEKEILVSRLVDRPIRPLFDSLYRCETQVLCTVLAHDSHHDADVAAMIGASAALTVSDLPFLGPIGAARVGYINHKLVLNPTLQQVKESQLDLVMACTDEGVLMVESEADELDESAMLDAVMFGQNHCAPVIQLINELAEVCGKPKRKMAAHPPWHGELRQRITDASEEKLSKVYQLADKKVRVDALNRLRDEIVSGALPEGASSEKKAAASSLFHDVEKGVVRNAVLQTKRRIDGRGLSDIRAIACEVGVLPLSHGSALFTRGETQALVIATLGTGQSEQIIDDLAGEYREPFMLHYNFPPFSTNEVKRVGGVSRREVGHGKLAWRAIRSVLPARDQFPYSLRLVSEILESNGSSSMATVCGSTLALMDGGIPLKRPVAGIAMGLIKRNQDFVVLSDILGDEDHLGDMDFKVAGSEHGVTALQMDIKITSITREIMEVALRQAREGRLHILAQMMKALPAARESLSASAPRIETMSIAKEKIREVIGVGGKVIREICEVSGAKVEVEDDGTVRIAATDSQAIAKAKEMVANITAVPEVGKIYQGTVVRCVDFGAFVNFLGGKDGLVHISELAHGRVERTTDVVNEGDKVTVRVLEIDDRGRVRLTMRRLEGELPPPSSRGGGGRGGPPPRRKRGFF